MVHAQIKGLFCECCCAYSFVAAAHAEATEGTTRLHHRLLAAR
ncbi:hypothetical protein HMPREF6745_1574 [Prevotella sp. oral taxon 472 str. F0295]|nr:hypothetical protein HMPREF6745_1574 [Prevotella sp. oral taxon 472 str. F0295]